MNEKEKFLRKVGLFKQVAPKALERLATETNLVYFPEGHLIRDTSRRETTATSDIDGLYIIKTGAAKVTTASDDGDVEAVIAGGGGVLEGIRAGAVVIDMSTISPATGQKMSGLLGERGAGFVDAPVTGGASGARDATLSVLAGGDSESYERVLPVLRARGSNVTHMGPGGSGHAAKLANQILGVGCMIGVAEGLVFAKKMGLDLRTFVEAASKGASTSWMLERQGPAILDGDFAPGFMARHMRKDLRLAAEAAGEVHAALPMATLVGQLYEQLLAEDDGDLGHHAIVRVIERLSNQEARA